MITPGPGLFAEGLRSLRMERGLTQLELAERAGVSSRAISDLERGINQRPRRETAIRLADVLGLLGADRLAFLDLARSRPRLPTAEARVLPCPALPPRRSPLHGRATELRAIERALLGDRVRLLTLTGPGGVGKTRLAIEIARRQAIRERFHDGVLFVRLDGLRDHRLVLPALAAELQLLDPGSDASRSETIAAFLADRQMLLILDNLEHLQAAAPDLASLLTYGNPARFLVTSRDALRIQAEHVLAVSPLPRPDPDTWAKPTFLGGGGRSAAIAVYVQRAREARPDLAIKPGLEAGRGDLAIIAETCHRLDGLPLAIELAAAQMASLSAAEILEQLKTAGLPLLADDRHDLPARHQTMAAAIAWSYDLLPAAEQALLRRLAVFAGSFSLPAAAAVFGPVRAEPLRPGECSPVPVDVDPVQLRTVARDAASFDGQVGNELRHLDPIVVQAVTSLARHNLLYQDTTVADHVGPRFRMLELVRLFALDRLCAAGEEAAVRLRHAEHFTRTAAVLDALAFGADPQIWLEWQVVDLDNFRAAQDWLLAIGEDDLVARLTAAIAQLWLIKGLLPEARQRVSAAIAVDTLASPATRWFLRFWAGTFAFEAGDLSRAGEYARELLAIAKGHDDRVGIGVGLTLLSRVEGATAGHQAVSIQLAQQAVETLLSEAHGEWLAWAWSRLGVEHHRAGGLEAAWRCHANSLEIRRRGSSEGCTSYSLVLLGAVALDRGDAQAALNFFREGLALTIKHDNPLLMLAVLLGLADLAWQFAASAQGSLTALQFFGAAEAIRRRHGLPVTEPVREIVSRWQAQLSGEIDHQAVESLLRTGARLTRQDISTLAAALHVTATPDEHALGHQPLSLLSALGSIE